MIMKKIVKSLSCLVVFSLISQNCVALSWGRSEEVKVEKKDSSCKTGCCVGCKADGCKERLGCRKCNTLESEPACSKCHKKMKSMCCCSGYPACMKNGKGKKGQMAKAKHPKKENKKKDEKKKGARNEKHSSKNKDHVKSNKK